MAGRWFRSVGWSKVEQVVLRNCHGGPTPTPSFVSQPLEHFASTWCNQQEVLGEGEDARGQGGSCVLCEEEGERCERQPVVDVQHTSCGCLPCLGSASSEKVNMRRGRGGCSEEVRKGQTLRVAYGRFFEFTT